MLHSHPRTKLFVLVMWHPLPRLQARPACTEHCCTCKMLFREQILQLTLAKTICILMDEADHAALLGLQAFWIVE